MTACPSQTLGITIHRPFDKVYSFLAEPSNFTQWASGLAKGLKKWGHIWMAETPEGMMKVKFSEKNDFGICDHSVFPHSDSEIYIPMRVIRNGSSSEVLLTLFQQPGMSEDKFKADAEWVRKDLQALKDLLEKT